MNAMQAETVSFTSTEGTTPIHGVIWWPRTRPRGIVQLVHGMSEHIMRYEPFANYLTERGLIACGHDHLGHGQSVVSPDDRGCLPTRTGRDILVNDVDLMRRLVTQKAMQRLGDAQPQDGDAASLPHFVFGHSMGSFVIRAYISQYGEGLAGAVICGTGHIAPAVSATGNRLARGIARARGERYVSKLLGDISIGAYAKAIDNPRTQLDWLSYNEDNVDSYLADELCGFAFSAGGNATLTALTREVCTRACCARVPHDLPLLYIAGDGDPVGNMGKGVRTAARMAREAGSTNVTCIVYEHMRHEILNEHGRERVMDDVYAWMEEHL